MLVLWKSTFGQYQAWLGGVRVNFVNTVTRKSIDTPAQKCHFLCLDRSAQYIYIGGQPKKNCSKYVKTGLSYHKLVVLPST